MKHLLILFIVVNILSCGKIFSQTDINMTTDWYNKGNLNPASIAKPGYIYLFTNARKQWLGIEGSPTVLNIQASDYFKSIHAAVGISMVSDETGPSVALNPMLTYAYRIAYTNWSLSFGMSAGVFSRYIKRSDLQADNMVDPAIYSDLETTIRPDANFGIEYQNHHFIIGLSTTHLFSIGKDSSLFLNSNHRYGYIIYKNTESEQYNYNFGIQVVNRYNLTIIEGNATIRFKYPTGLISGPKELFDIGVTYRTSNEVVFLFGINISPDFRVGYAFDQSLNVGYNQKGTHEIMLDYRIPN